MLLKSDTKLYGLSRMAQLWLSFLEDSNNKSLYKN